jgi:hypothetical protein
VLLVHSCSAAANRRRVRSCKSVTSYPLHHQPGAREEYLSREGARQRAEHQVPARHAIATGYTMMILGGMPVGAPLVMSVQIGQAAACGPSQSLAGKFSERDGVL